MVASGTPSWLQSPFCICTWALSSGYTMGSGRTCGTPCEQLSGFSGYPGCVQGGVQPWLWQNPPGAQCLTAGLHWEPSLLSAWSLPAALAARRIWGLTFSSSWTRRGEESGMSVLPADSVLRTGLQLGGRRGGPSRSCSQSSARGGCEWLPGPPRSERVRRHLGPQGHHFLVDSPVAACVCVGPLCKCLRVS